MDTENPHRLPDEHAIDWAARLVKGRSVLAEHLGVTVAALGNWKLRGVPIEKCVPIERFTGGRVARRYLRPQDFLEIWPELGEAPSTTAPAVVLPVQQSLEGMAPQGA